MKKTAGNKCKAKTEKGNQCKRFCRDDIPYQYCWQHWKTHCHRIAMRGEDLLGKDVFT